MASDYLKQPRRTEEQVRADRAQVRRQLKASVALIRSVTFTPIKTNYWMKPIPPRQFDWEATRGDPDLGCLVGYGKTEEAAVLDLLSLEADRDHYIIDSDEDFLTLSDALFDACCAMKAEKAAEELWESNAIERCNYDMRRS